MLIYFVRISIILKTFFTCVFKIFSLVLYLSQCAFGVTFNPTGNSVVGLLASGSQADISDHELCGIHGPCFCGLTKTSGMHLVAVLDSN